MATKATYHLFDKMKDKLLYTDLTKHLKDGQMHVHGITKKH